MHISGINYTEKGEINHLPFRKSDFPYKYILKELKDRNYKGTIICESPETVSDCLFIKNIYNKL
ncbi:MAG: hypothetical protein PHR26_03730 [Candidatus ainarchaeum sp.]|nr:hypothetical protein [Candidatus ainarchaeum sp.]